MSALTDLIFAGSNAVAGLTEGAVNDAIAKYGADAPVAFPDFTGGRWTERSDIADNEYTLDKLNNGRDIYFAD